MAEFFTQYGLFFAKTLTFVLAFGLCLALIAAVRKSEKRDSDDIFSIESLNEQIDEMKEEIEAEIYQNSELDLIDGARQKEEKERAKKEKAEAKAKKKKLKAGKVDVTAVIERRPRTYVLDFDGDIEASQVKALRKMITGVLTLAEAQDEVVVRLTSPGGMVHAYGLAASQLERIKRADIPLTVCVDGVAASGGYMMACIANKILAAPFAIIGSIGVVAEVPNVNRLLKKYDVDYDVYTAGEFKRTVTVFGENTEQGKEKFVEDLERTHVLFKEFVSSHRPSVDIEAVATGETWYGSQAVNAGLVDGLMTSDQFLTEQCDERDVFLVALAPKRKLENRLSQLLSNVASTAIVSAVNQVVNRGSNKRFF